MRLRCPLSFLNLSRFSSVCNCLYVPLCASIFLLFLSFHIYYYFHSLRTADSPFPTFIFPASLIFRFFSSIPTGSFQFFISRSHFLLFFVPYVSIRNSSCPSNPPNLLKVAKLFYFSNSHSFALILHFTVGTRIIHSSKDYRRLKNIIFIGSAQHLGVIIRNETPC